MSKSSDLLKLSDVPSRLALLKYPELPDEQGLIVPEVMRLDAEEQYASFIRKAIRDGQLVQRSHAGTPISGDRDVWQGAYVLEADLQRVLDINGIQIQLDNPPETESKRSNEEVLELLKAERDEVNRLGGRYTLEEAAEVLEQEAGERSGAVLRRLVKAANAGELPMYGPGENLRRDYGEEHTRTVRDFYEEAYWNDLNKWLKNYEPHISFRFQCPSSQATDERASDLSERKPLFSKQRWQENKVIEALRALGYDPMALPRTKPGVSGVKAKVREKCLSDNPEDWFGTIFNKAWERCMGSDQIAYRK